MPGGRSTDALDFRLGGVALGTCAFEFGFHAVQALLFDRDRSCIKDATAIGLWASAAHNALERIERFHGL